MMIPTLPTLLLAVVFVVFQYHHAAAVSSSMSFAVPSHRRRRGRAATTTAFLLRHGATSKTQGSCFELHAEIDSGNDERKTKTAVARRLATKAKKKGGGKAFNNNTKKKHRNKSFDGAGTSSSGLRELVTDYDSNRNDGALNRRRIEDDEIGCEHFDEGCSGCVVSTGVGRDIGVLKSAKLYFSSTAVRRRRLDVMRAGMQGQSRSSGESNNDDVGDGFYKVVIPSPVTGWRTQAKLAVAPKSSSWSKDGCSFGLYRRGTHSILSIPNCAVHHPSINRAVHLLVEATSKVGTAAFSEDSREGGLRYVQFQVERSTGRVCLTLVWNAATIKETHPALPRLVKELKKLGSGGGDSSNSDTRGALWHSIWVHCNDGIGNSIFNRNPKRWHRLTGPEFVREPVPVGDRGWLYFSPLAFRQGNMDGFDVLANDVARAVPGGSKVCELYAGVGLLGLTSLAYHADSEAPLVWVRCSDENPSNPRCFRLAVESLPSSVTGRRSNHIRSKGRWSRDEVRKGSVVEEEDGMTLEELASMMESGKSLPLPVKGERTGAKMSYLVSSASAALRSGQALGAQVLIVDPPRKGLEEPVLRELCKPYNPDQPYVESTTVLTMDDEKVNWTNDVQTLIYVSCGFDALARDAEALLSSPGDWTLANATGYVLFPGSDHVESLCVFQRE